MRFTIRVSGKDKLDELHIKGENAARLLDKRALEEYQKGLFRPGLTQQELETEAVLGAIKYGRYDLLESWLEDPNVASIVRSTIRQLYEAGYIEIDRE